MRDGSEMSESNEMSDGVETTDRGAAWRREGALGLLAALLVLAMAALPAEAAPRRKPHATRIAQQAVADDSAPDSFLYGSREDVQRFADEVAARHGLDPARVRGTLAQARFLPNVARFIVPPVAGTAKSWAAYRARFIEPMRIGRGLAFWRDNAAALERAEREYGVPAEIIVGIVGVETLYGQQMGGFRIVDALATLAFDFPVQAARRDRSAFFRDELEQWLVLAQAEGLDPLSVRGSYAGAIGLPQFMPSSIARWAVDFDGDGRIDLRNDPADAIGSVARYLAEHGWVQGLAPHFPVSPPVETVERATLLVPDIEPTFSVQEMAAHGAVVGPLSEGFDGKLALVELQNGDAAPSYVAGTQNFYALTRYNQSSYYAMAVIELGAAVARERAAAGRPPAAASGTAR